MRYSHLRGAVCAALLLTAAQVDAQRRPGAGRRAALTLSAEQVRRSYGRLELTAEQITALEAIQEDVIQRRRQAEDRLRGLCSQLRADDITRNQIREEVRANLESARESHEAHRDGVREVLTEDQLGQLNRARRRFASRGGRAGRGAGAGRDRSRGGRGGLPGC